jgi:hypothetical protein
MAEQVTVVCDVCGRPSAETVAITARDTPYRKDLCSEHLAELLRGARAPRRGRPSARGATASAAPATEGPKRRGRPPKARTQPAAGTSAEGQGAKWPRRRITDPVVLKKRRAALVKARAARAAKRAAAAAGAS